MSIILDDCVLSKTGLKNKLLQEYTGRLPKSTTSRQAGGLRKGSRDAQALQSSQVSQNGVASDWSSLDQAPSWGRDQAPPDWGSGFNPPQQLFHRSKSVPLIPNRLRVFAGTSNSVSLCSHCPELDFYFSH